MTNSVTLSNHPLPDPHQDSFSKAVFGFWIYLMSDCILFSSLFATYAVLHHNTFGGPAGKEIFSLPLSLAETLILLVSSVTSGFALLCATQNKKKGILFWLCISFLLGLSFVTLEVREFIQFVHEGNTWNRSAFLSSFFTLVGTHGAHVSVGLLWMFVMMIQVLWQGVTISTFRRLVCFNMFWHFLDLVWIFIFTFVYLIGAVS